MHDVGSLITYTHFCCSFCFFFTQKSARVETADEIQVTITTMPLLLFTHSIGFFSLTELLRTIDEVIKGTNRCSTLNGTEQFSDCPGGV